MFKGPGHVDDIYQIRHGLVRSGEAVSKSLTGELVQVRGRRGEGADSRLRIYKGPGLVTEVFSNQQILTDVLPGDVAIGHNR